MEKVRNPKFLDAQAKIEQQKREAEAAESRKGSFEGYDEKVYLGLEDKQEVVFRPLGSPIHVREEGTDPKLIFFSQIVKDSNDGYINVIWPHIESNGKYVPDPDWILTRLYNAVNDGTWKERAESEVKPGMSKWYKEPIHSGTDVFKRIDGNRKEGERGFAKKFWPSQKVLINVIDRHDSWCKENKHSKILSSKVTRKFYKNDDGTETENVYAAVGIPITLYTELFNHFMRRCGDWSFDAVVTKDAENKNNIYSVIDVAVDQMITSHSKEIGSVNDLTEEEKNYTLYDFDFLFPITSYYKLKNNLSGLFKLCDALLGTSFYDELNKLVDIETEEYKLKKEMKEKEEQKVFVGYQDKTLLKEVMTKIDLEEVKEVKEINQRKPVQEESKESTKLVKEDLIKVFPFYNNLDENDKIILEKCVISISEGRPLFKHGSDELTCYIDTCKYPNSNFATLFPSSMRQCPVCGATEAIK